MPGFLAAAAPYGLSALGGMAQGLMGGQQEREQINRIGIPQQARLIDMLARSAQRGQGEFGFGPAMQQGTATLRDMMGQRGISPTSGAYNSALAQLIAQAMSQDIGNRRQFALGVAQARPFTATAHSFKGPIWEDPTGRFR